jgi:hypothetical protein
MKPNDNKKLNIEVNKKIYSRIPIKTHFVKVHENLDDIIQQYVKPKIQKDDIVFISQKVLALCLGNIVYKKDLKLSKFAKFLSKFAQQTSAGPAVGDPYKMQIAINSAGLPRILFAAFCAAIGKIFKIKGVFYRVAGNQINQIDGFCDDAFEDYMDMGILGFKNCDSMCEEIKNKHDFSCAVVDVNDIGGNLLGATSDIDKKLVIEILKDNPLGQGSQSTPIGVIREV